MLLRFKRVFVLGLLTTSVLVASVDGQETEKKTFFLPKSPVAAAYVLGRLSNKELAEAPRSEFVFVAMLQRKGLERRYRVEAVEGLAKIHSTDPLTELLGGIVELDKKGEASESVLRDLSTILLQSKPEGLSVKRDLLLKLANESQLGTTRQIACAAVVTADGSGERRWKEVDSNPSQLADLLLSLSFIRDPNIRGALHPKVEPLIHKADPAEVRRAAISALPAIPGHDAESFAALAAFVKSGTERETAIAGLQKIPRKSWPVEQAESLIESLVPYLQGVPVEKRTEVDAVNAFQFANDLTALLPPEKAGAVSKTLRALGVSVFVIRTIPERMLYDKNLIVVEAGKPVSLILINDDAMPHNLVVTAPGAVAEIGPITETMPPDPDSSGRLYIPASPKVLHGTKLVEPGQQARLSFIAPKEPGDYQYVCTFPGHWRLMVGKLAVVEDVEAYLATHAAATQPKITEWKTDDLVPQLSKLDSGRNLQQGRENFTRLACASCHKLGAEGASYGPELTDVFSRYQNNPAEVLRQIIEPSLIVSNRYRGFDFELQNGDELSGMVVKEDGDVLTVQTGPAASLVQTLKKSAVTTQKPQKSSLMPVGLLNTLSAEEILDLLAFVKSGGNAAAHQHAH
ncbi:MAG: c-type cytochrome [Verrucomicrobia bacterium]|nr:c-type cytochrome [Verrucomicrobiota bacterium]